MAATQVRAEYDALRDVAGKFQQESDRISKSLQTLQRQADGLVGKSWIGQGATAFDKQLGNEIYPTFQKLSQALGQTSDVLQKVSKVFADAESEGKSGMQKITINITIS